MTTNLDRPNGITFSHDEKKLYIADTGENISTCMFLMLWKIQYLIKN